MIAEICDEKESSKTDKSKEPYCISAISGFIVGGIGGGLESIIGPPGFSIDEVIISAVSVAIGSSTVYKNITFGKAMLSIGAANLSYRMGNYITRLLCGYLRTYS